MTVDSQQNNENDSGLEQLDRLESTIKTLNKVLDVHKVELNKAQNVAKVGVIVGIIGIVVGLVGGAVGLDGRSQAQAIKKARTEARTSACIQANVATSGTRNALITGLLVFADDPQHLTPKEQLILNAYTLQVEKAQPYRDCSNSGIEEYYSNPPDDPAKK